MGMITIPGDQIVLEDANPRVSQIGRRSLGKDHHPNSLIPNHGFMFQLDAVSRLRG